VLFEMCDCTVLVGPNKAPVINKAVAKLISLLIVAKAFLAKRLSEFCEIHGE
jgi:hypothetical protein